MALRLRLRAAALCALAFIALPAVGRCETVSIAGKAAPPSGQAAVPADAPDASAVAAPPAASASVAAPGAASGWAQRIGAWIQEGAAYVGRE